jgi:NhaA family Na+:H+ antiporter
VGTAQALADRWVQQPIRNFMRLEASGGILLVSVTLVALVWANSGFGGLYHDLWHLDLGLALGSRTFSLSLHHWINDGLMAVFFFWVGLEIKREMLTGELASWRRAALPVMGALGGMVVPALLYLWLNHDGEAARGWGIPMATDIAFAIGILMLLGSRVPLGLKVFLTALAVVDDLGAVVVIAMFYTAELSLGHLAVGLVLLAGLWGLAQGGLRGRGVFTAVGLVVWILFLRSGVHATVAGVLTAMTVPHRVREEGPSPLERWEHELAPWVAYVIMPIFALANAGVVLHGAGITGALVSPIPLGILLGLFVGKQLGVFGFAWLSVKLGWAALPAGAGWRSLYGVAVLGGIGFTMSLFITNLAFSVSPGAGHAVPAHVDEAKLGILVGSLISALFGTLLLLLATRKAGGDLEDSSHADA